MGVPTSEVGYTIATTRKETTKVHKNMWHGGGVPLIMKVTYTYMYTMCTEFLHTLSDFISSCLRNVGDASQK